MLFGRRSRGRRGGCGGLICGCIAIKISVLPQTVRKVDLQGIVCVLYQSVESVIKARNLNRGGEEAGQELGFQTQILNALVHVCTESQSCNVCYI